MNLLLLYKILNPYPHSPRCPLNDANWWEWEVNPSWMTALVPYWSAGTALMWESSGGDLHPLSHHTEGRSPFTGGNCVVWT